MPVKVIGPAFGAVTATSPGASGSAAPTTGAWSRSNGSARVTRRSVISRARALARPGGRA